MTRLAIVIPAAGASSRMRGRDKLLEVVDGQPILRLTATRARAISEDVYVTLPSLSGFRAEALQGLQTMQIEVPDAAEGMAASLRQAAKHIPDYIDGVMILPADMPDLTQDDLASVMEAFQTSEHKAIIQGMGNDGTPGHPVIFPQDLIGGFAKLTGDIGARTILKRNKDRLRYVMLPNTHAVTDLDTPEAWEAWRKDHPDR
jgi:CTP:molybdopterin cytidylyltransferase MocA